LLLLKLNTFYSKKLKIESKGSRYEIGDFVVKLGVVSASSSFKGILVTHVFSRTKFQFLQINFFIR